MPDGCDTDENGTDFSARDEHARRVQRRARLQRPARRRGADRGEHRSRGTVRSAVDPGASITVTFSEPVTTAAGAFALACTDGRSYAVTATSADQTAYTVDPAASLPRGERCTLTVAARP